MSHRPAPRNLHAAPCNFLVAEGPRQRETNDAMRPRLRASDGTLATDFTPDLFQGAELTTSCYRSGAITTSRQEIEETAVETVERTRKSGEQTDGIARKNWLSLVQVR